VLNDHEFVPPRLRELAFDVEARRGRALRRRHLVRVVLLCGLIGAIAGWLTRSLWLAAVAGVLVSAYLEWRRAR